MLRRVLSAANKSSSFIALKSSNLSNHKNNFQSVRFFSKEVEIEFDVPFETHKCESPPNKATTTSEELLDFYTKMLLLRRLETASDQLYKSRDIHGFCHLYSGQEAVCVGMEAVLSRKDHVISAYRDHALFIGRGGSANEVMAELLGKETGCSKGKGGSMHMYSKKHRFYGGNGIVGAQVPVGTGIALAQQYLGTGEVCVAMYGDGAANQGQVFESYNMAALWKLPVIYICENNRYAMGTSTQRSSVKVEYYQRGDFIPGIKIDGMNVLAVKTAFRHAVNFVKEHGPILLEMSTYRYSGHSMSDPGTTYRTREEIQQVRESKDPIAYTKNKLLKLQLATEEEIKQIDKQVKKEIDDAVQFAKNSSQPDLSQLFTDIYAEMPSFVRAVELDQSFVRTN
jgi:pyruvate dehydrogenase E1 component alpha subunit